MAEENEGLLSYFQRMMTKLMAVCSSETGFSDVQDDYLATMIVDSIERIFMHGRKQDPERCNSWEVLKMGVDRSTNLDLLLATHTRSLERQIGISPVERSSQFFQYAILHKVLSNFCSQLTQNAELIASFYYPGYILSSNEHSTMFVLQLSTLETLNFSAIWSNQNTMGAPLEDSSRPQVTSIVQGSAVPLPSPGSGKLLISSSPSKPAPQPTRPTETQEQSRASLLFGGSEAPLTFSLKPRSAPSNPFAQAFAIQPSASDSSISTPASSAASSTSSLPASFASTSSESSSLASSGSFKASPPVSHKETPPSSEPSYRTTEHTSTEPAPISTAVITPAVAVAEKSPAVLQPAHTATIEATVEAPVLAVTDSPGSTKKRVKKRTINL